MELRAEAVSKNYLRKMKGRNVFSALKETTLTLSTGEITAVTGRSGSGKSTLLNILAGILSPTGGRVLLEETDLYTLSDDARAKLRNDAIGVVPQGQTALQSLTVMENIMLPFAFYGESPDVERAHFLMGRLGIAQLAEVRPRELSGGEIRRLAIARALVKKPGVLLADEPTGDLDDENTAVVMQLLREAADEGAAVLLVTHEHDVLCRADRAFYMDGGVLRPAGESGSLADA